MEFVQNLKNIGKADAAVAGGKGASLGEMMRIGIPVPAGFVVSANAFEHFLREAGLNQEAERSDKTRQGELKKKIIEAPMPQDVSEEILKIFRELDPGKVAVRSSAAAEDGSESAWAGQFESFLGVDESSLLESVKKCWASIYEDRVLWYGEKKGSDAKKNSIAVVVQKMINSRVSGISFSKDPTDPDSGKLIIEAGYGLGESLVSGKISPDRYIVEREGPRVSGRFVNRQTQKIVPLENGNTGWKDVLKGEESSQKISDTQIKKLAELVLYIEGELGYPVDVEWAMDESGNIFIVQARPITFRARDPEIPKGAWSNVNLAEVLSGVNPPLVSDTVKEIITPAFCRLLGSRAETEIIGTIKGRLYFNVIEVQKLFKNIIGDNFAITDLFGGSGDIDKKSAKMSLHAKFLLLRFAVKALFNSFFWSRNFKKQAAAVRPLASSFERRVSEAKKPSDLLIITDEITVLLKDLMAASLTGITYQISFYFIYAALCQKWLKEKGNRTAHELYASGGTQLQLVQAFASLWRISQAIVEDNVIKNEFLASKDEIEAQEALKKGQDVYVLWQEFLKEHGYRTVNEINFSLPRWKEDPSFIISVLKNYVNAPRDLDPSQKFLQLKDEQVKRLKEISGSLPGWKAGLLAYLLRRGRQGMDEREYAKSELIRMFEPLRAAYLKIGSMFVSDGILEKQEDIFMLSRSELTEILSQGKEVRALIEERKEKYKNYAKLEMPEFFADIESGISLPVEKSLESFSILKGLAVSHGIVKGTARVVTDIKEITRIRSGDILVTDHTDPGWTPVFVTVGGVVTNIGGLLSHAAIVAREYGLPAVANVKDATKLIKDGQEILLDGDAGTVTLM